MQLSEYTADQTRVDLKKLWKESLWTLEEAKNKWPEWYHDKVELNLPKKTWTCKSALYEWWLRKIYEGAAFGHRYFCIMALAIYAAKCHIPYEKLREDAYSLIPFLNNLNSASPFTAEDVESALECYDERYKTFPRKDIEKITSIRIEPNKRNYLKQSDHLEEARAIRDIRMRRQGKKWTDGNGPKPKDKIVKQWRENHPEGTKKQCKDDTGLTYNTIRKWWTENA